MKIRKNSLMLCLAVSILMSVAILPIRGQMVTTLAIYPEETIGTDDFTIYVTVDDVAEMWGYQFAVFYDTSVLTATGFGGVYPFLNPRGSEPYLGGWIDDAVGYVVITFSMEPSEPIGHSTKDPYPIAWVSFTVDGGSASGLSIGGTPDQPSPYDESVISDIHGDEIFHVTVPGYWASEAGLPIADFYWMPMTPIIGDRVTFTSTSTDPDGFITAWSWDFGDGDTGTGDTVTHRYRYAGDYTVTLTVTDNDGKTDSQSKMVTVLPKPVPEGVELRESKAAHRMFDVSVRDPATINTFTAWVKSLNPQDDTEVRVVWSIWGPGMTALGGMEATGTLGPKELAKFTADFDIFDARWEYEGDRMDYEVRTEVYYRPSNPPPEWAPGSIAGVPGTEWFSVTTTP